MSPDAPPRRGRAGVADRRLAARRLPEPGAADAALIDRYLDATWAETGMSPATRESYRRDLAGLARRATGDGALLAADGAALSGWLGERARAGYSPRSTARLLSALRGFYGWCVREGLRGDDPTALLGAPALPRLLPKALTETQVAALLAAPDVATPEGLRALAEPARQRRAVGGE
jgi:integrase/recombinase XerD